MSRRSILEAISICCIALSVSQTVVANVDFNRDVAPILVKRCLECHNEHEAAGGLVLTTRQYFLIGGESGSIVVPGNAESSLVLERVASGEMPPESKGTSKKLPDAEIQVLEQWISSGASWPESRKLDLYEATSDVRAGRDWWSLQPINREALPNWDPSLTNPIDAVVHRKLKETGFEPAPQADGRTLIRRLYFDLIGLPPSYEEIEAFVADQDPEAWEKLVRKLLNSPHYGERWARYWLDLVRFAETSGYERDQEKPFAWKYRDWVVKAFNDDMPYDQFIREQIAGDEVHHRNESSVIATGMLRLGTWNDEPNDGQDYKYERLEDLVHVTSSAFLGLTVKCARCHDHKFDPIPQTDYYRIAAAFWAGPIEPRDRKLLGGPSADELGFEDILGWTDLGKPTKPLRVLKNGNRHQPMQEVSAGALSAIPALDERFAAADRSPDSNGWRLGLANWIADNRNPLTTRVIVNRIWQHHFGKGLVRTPNNFGFRGAPPTHPELLDWLASNLVTDGWSLKMTHWWILTSETWRQASTHPRSKEYEQKDFENRLWWRSERRRLDAEALRDSMLSVSGELELQLGGPSFRPTISPEALEGLSRKASAWTASPPEDQKRRSLYMYTKRHLLQPMMTAFNFCDTTQPTAQRDVTTVAPQALALLNNSFSHDRSTALARRVHSIASTPEARVESAWKFALGRLPGHDEKKLALAHLASQETRFSDPKSDKRAGEPWRHPASSIVDDGLVLHLRADKGVQLDPSGRVLAWKDQSSANHNTFQGLAERRPILIRDGFNGRLAIRFDGKRRFLSIDGQLLASPESSFFVVANDRGPAGHREIISNWDGSEGNSTRSIFLGLTGDRQIRFSDAFGNAGQVSSREQPFLLSAINSEDSVLVFQNATELALQTSSLPNRRLDTNWVIGQQGDIDGEYWDGDIAEILVYDRALSTAERQQIWSTLLNRYSLPTFIQQPAEPPTDPEFLALASLCHVLLNSNEFIYVD